MKWPSLGAVLFVFQHCALAVPPQALAQKAKPAPVTGWIDAIRYEGGQYYVSGWACQQGNRDSIYVFFTADRSPWDKPPGPSVTGGKADLNNEPAVDRACREAPGGKHRFKIAISNQLLRTFQKRKLYARGWTPTPQDQDGPLTGAGKFVFPEPKWLPDPPTPDFFDGPQAASFDTKRESCEKTDIPDAAARAFRDYKGTVHLVSSASITRAGLGPTLETAKHNCQVVYSSHRDANPAHFDDYIWLSTFYNIDGKRIVALGHMEYHGDEHPGMCTVKDTSPCWYNADTFNISEDGGYHFSHTKPPAHYLLSLPYQYQVNQGPEGYSVDSNIIKVGDWYYAAIYSWAWPRPCGGDRDSAAAWFLMDHVPFVPAIFWIRHHGVAGTERALTWFS